MSGEVRFIGSGHSEPMEEVDYVISHLLVVGNEQVRVGDVAEARADGVVDEQHVRLLRPRIGPGFEEPGVGADFLVEGGGGGAGLSVGDV